MYRVAYSILYDSERHYSRWLEDRDMAVWMFHELAASGAYSIFIQHDRRAQ
jgi:hypothetical protein